MGELIRFGVSMPEVLLKRFDEHIDNKGYSNRSEAVRDLIRNALLEEEWQDEDVMVAGTITLIYEHHYQRLSDQLNELQHEEHDLIISTLHVHLDQHNCLEVIVLRGKINRLRNMADRLISSKGVKHGKLTLTSTGVNLV